MKRKRSSISRKPRANYDALFQSFSGWSSHAEPFRKHAENENLRDTVVASDGLATDYRPTKLKLKFGGVTHTIHAKSKTETGSIRATGQNINVVHEHVRKSKRITKRYALDVGFSDEDNVNAELHFLEKSNASKRAVSHPKGNRGGSIKDGKNNFNSEKKYEDQDYAEEDPTSSDESILEGEKPKRESDNLLVRRKQRVLINRNGSVDSFKDVLSRADANIIDTSGKKGKLSEEQQIKKAEAAKRRKIQSEKAAREAESAAIRKILGQDSARKKKEEKMNKRRDDFAKEKSSRSLNLGSNTVRYTMGPNGTIVTFSEDIGLPSIFQTIPSSYPPPREKCAGPNCTNAYKYRDSKSKLPLCSLGCYRAIHEKIPHVVAC